MDLATGVLLRSLAKLLAAFDAGARTAHAIADARRGVAVAEQDTLAVEQQDRNDECAITVVADTACGVRCDDDTKRE